MNLHEKLVEIRKEIPYLKKDTEGHNYNYVSGSSLISAIRGKMDELGVLLIPQVANTEKIVQDKKAIVSFDMNMVWINAEKPEEKIEVSFAGFGCQSDISKAFGSALTYSERYFLLKFFNVATDNDDPDAFQERTNRVPNELEQHMNKFSADEKKGLMKVFNNNYNEILNFGQLNAWVYSDMVSAKLEVNPIVSDIVENMHKHKGTDLEMYYGNITRSVEYNGLSEIEKKYITKIYKEVK